MRLSLAAIAALICWTSAADGAVPIVYSRCPRTAAPFQLSGMIKKGGVSSTASITISGGDMYEMLPDTTKQRDGFVAPCDLVYRDGDGNEKILYSCIEGSTPENACAALDPAVSFDGKTIAFAVFRGKLEHLWASVSPKELDPAADDTGSLYPRLPGYALQSTEAQLYLVDVASGVQTALAHEPGVFDFGPVWLPNGRLGFNTDRSNTYQTMPLCKNTNPKALQYASMSIDGFDVERPTVHALAGELHPYPLADGRLLISSWQLFGMLAYGHPNSIGGCGTLNNKFHLYALNPDGSNQSAVYGQHLDDPTYTENQPDFSLRTHMSAHFLAQSSDGRIWVDEYYRDNNLGLGIISGFKLPPEGQEGETVAQAEAKMLSAYRPPEQVQLAPWASNADQDAALMPAPPLTVPGYADPLHYAGKIGHPAAVPNNALLLTWGKGTCTTASGKTFVDTVKSYAATAKDNPYCDTGIYLSPTLPAQQKGALFNHPSALTVVVDRPEFHEFFPRAVLPYKEIMGIDAPPVLPPAVATGRQEPELGVAQPYGLLGSSSIIHRETKPSGGRFNFEASNQMSHVGTDVIDYADDELCGVRVLAVLPNRKEEYKKVSTAPASERLMLLGEFPVRHGGEKDALGLPETSFRARIPADVPYIMQGIDCKGRTLNTDQTWQHLAPGEMRTCNGCHVHSAAAEQLPFAATLAGQRKVDAARLGEGMVQLLAGKDGDDVKVSQVASWGLQVEFERDVMPIFQQRCVSCHGAAKSDAGLRLDLPRSAKMREEPSTDDSTYRRLAMDEGQSLVPMALRHQARQGTTLEKPNLSKYVRMLNARGSLLYWKAANQRTDGRTDAQFPSSATPGETNRGQFDVDFGAAHPTDITEEELATLARWIDMGAMWGPDTMEDTIAPSLALEGRFEGDALTGIVVGTTDVGSGIAPASLGVCTRVGGGACAMVASTPQAAMAGTVEIAVSGLSNPTDEVEVRVSDAAGNTTTIRRTLRALAGLPPPGPVSSGGGESGCGCSLSATRPRAMATLLLGLIGVALLRRRARAGRRVDLGREDAKATHAT